jgi:hypothetical protein
MDPRLGERAHVLLRSGAVDRHVGRAHGDADGGLDRCAHANPPEQHSAADGHAHSTCPDAEQPGLLSFKWPAVY